MTSADTTLSHLAIALFNVQTRPTLPGHMQPFSATAATKSGTGACALFGRKGERITTAPPTDDGEKSPVGCPPCSELELRGQANDAGATHWARLFPVSIRPGRMPLNPISLHPMAPAHAATATPRRVRDVPHSE
jgi:hypothetical protein